MKKVTPLIVSINDITCEAMSRSQFDEMQLTQGAQSILDGGGLITPLILRRHGLEKYTVESGYFEYYAALKAYEVDAIAGANIDAYVIDNSNETIMTEQMAMFRQRSEVVKDAPIGTDSSIDGILNNIIAKLTAFDRIERQLQVLGGLTGLDSVVTKLDQLDHIQPILQRLETIEETLKQTKGQRIKKSGQPTWSVPDIDALTLQKLNEISETELQRLKTRIPKLGKLKTLIEVRVNQPFESSRDLVARVNLTQTQFNRLMDKLKGYSLKSAVPSQAEEVDSTSSTTVSPSIPTVQTMPKPVDPEPLQVPASVAMPTEAPVIAENTHTQAAEPETMPFTPSAVEAPEQVAEPIQPPTEPKQDDAAVALNIINTLPDKELFFRLKRANLKDNVITALMKDKPYASFSDINVPGLGQAGLEKLKKSLSN